MARLFVLVLLVDLALVVTALVGCLTAAETAIRSLPRVGWVFVILLFGPVGAVAWFVAGRPADEFRIGPTPAHPAAVLDQAAVPARAVGPDDDPEFLRGLAEAIKARNAQES